MLINQPRLLVRWASSGHSSPFQGPFVVSLRSAAFSAGPWQHHGSHWACSVSGPNVDIDTLALWSEMEISEALRTPHRVPNWKTKNAFLST